MTTGYSRCLIPRKKSLRMAGKQGTLETNEEFINHPGIEHDLVVKREGETGEKARARAKNKRIITKNCICPSYVMKQRVMKCLPEKENEEKIGGSRNEGGK